MHRLSYLFRNAHAIAKQNRSLTDYKLLCQVDKSKGLDIGNTYQTEHAAHDFIGCIAKYERDTTVTLLKESPFISFMMDGTTDISGDEQETIYIQSSLMGKVTEIFLHIGSPESTTSVDLYEYFIAVIKEYK